MRTYMHTCTHAQCTHIQKEKGGGREEGKEGSSGFRRIDNFVTVCFLTLFRPPPPLPFPSPSRLLSPELPFPSFFPRATCTSRSAHLNQSFVQFHYSRKHDKRGNEKRSVRLRNGASPPSPVLKYNYSKYPLLKYVKFSLLK